MSNILFWLYAKIQRLKEIPWGLSMTGRLTILKCFFDSKIISRYVKCIDNDIIYKVRHELTDTASI